MVSTGSVAGAFVPDGMSISIFLAGGVWDCFTSSFFCPQAMRVNAIAAIVIFVVVFMIFLFDNG